MEEKIKELYHNYLYRKLDLVFSRDEERKKYRDYYDNLYRLPEILKKDGKYYFVTYKVCAELNFNESLLNKMGFDRIYNFENGFYLVRNSMKYNFVNHYGSLISDEWFDEAWNFSHGFARVRNRNKYNYINRYGKLVSNEWFDEVEKLGFSNGYAHVENNDRHNYINTNGQIISSEWFDDVEESGFKYGYASVRRGKECNYIGTNGQIISDEWFDIVEKPGFEYGCAQVYKNRKYNYINTQGKLIFDEWFDHVYDFTTDLKIVEKNGKYNYINNEGKLISNIWVDMDGERLKCPIYENRRHEIVKSMYSSVHHRGFTSYEPVYIRPVWINKKKSFIAVFNGKILSAYDKHIFYKNYVLIKNKSFIEVDGKIIPFNISLDNYSVKKNIMGYRMFNKTERFNIKYEPIKVYGERYILCLDKNNVYLYDRFKDNYKLINHASKIIYDDNFIFDNENDKVYFINENEFLDITEYYNLKLRGEKDISIVPGIKIETLDSFTYTNSEEIDSVIKEDLSRKKQLEDEKREEEQLKNAIKEEKAIQKQEEDLRRNIEFSLSKLNELSKRKKIQKIKSKNILKREYNYYVFKPSVINHLRFFDLSIIDFHNVKVEGIDFRGTNVEIENLLDCYNRSLRNCNFEGISISPFTDFTGVDIRGCRFSREDNSHIIDSMPNFYDAVYDETTTYNGVPISKILNVKTKHL